jgi:hypothetical protein
MAKRWGKERTDGGPDVSDEEFEEMLGTMLPTSCSGAKCERRAHLMFPGDSPYEGGFYMGKGWTSVVAESPPAVRFLWPECFQKEVTQDRVTMQAGVPVKSPVSG